MKLNKKQLREMVIQEMSMVEACSGKAPDIKGLDDAPTGAVMHKSHDREGRMTKAHLYHMMKYASGIYDMIDDDDDLPEWVQSKIARAVEKLSSVYHYMDSHENQPESIGHM